MIFEYEKENEQYQSILNGIYNGSIKPVERFWNPRATILHYCDKCENEFYARPFRLINIENQKHICFVSYGDSNGGRADRSGSVIANKNRKLTDKQKSELLGLAENGKSVSEIAFLFGVKASLVRYQMKKANYL